MAFELLISFSDPDIDVRRSVKNRVIAWLEAIGRFDYVEGVIDGVETALTESEEESGLTDEDRMSVSPIAVFDQSEAQSMELWRALIEEFGGDVRGAISEITDESWQQCWRDDFSPMATRKFFVAPLGDASPTPDGLTRVEIDAAGDAFGTGQHATTRAVIDVMEKSFPVWKPKSLLDVGTGTGIYLILASHLGVSKLAGTEISRELTDLALANCDAAAVSADIILCDRPRFDTKFDVVIANILVPVLHDLMPDIASLTSPGGRLIVAGFVQKEEAPLMECASRFGFKVESVTDDHGWKCVVLIKGP